MASTWKKDMGRFKRNLVRNADVAHRVVGISILAGRAATVDKSYADDGETVIAYTHPDGAGVVGQSTVLTGNLVENWQLSVGPSEPSWDSSATAQNAQNAVARVSGAIEHTNAGETLYLSNATPYIANVEYSEPGDYHWQQEGGWIRNEADKFGQEFVDRHLKYVFEDEE